MGAVIEVEDLAKSYGSNRVLDGVHLRVDGGVLGLLGHNGAGKSTLVSVLTTLERPDRGTARVAGVDVVARPAAARRLLRVTSQAASVDELLTGRENLVLLGRLLGLGSRAARERAEELLTLFELEPAAGRPVGRYSGGMRRRLDVAASLVDRPPVLFLDEPTTGLDPVSRARLWEHVRRLAAEGTTVLLTTQMLDEAEALSDRIAVLRQGRVVAEGTTAELTSGLGGETVVLVDGAGRVVRTVESDGSAAGLARILTGLGPREEGLQVQLRRPTLDDVFVTLTQAEEVAA